MALTVDVLLPLHVEQLFSYLVPAPFESSIREGCRVVVPLGKAKTYTGIVINISNRGDCENIKSITGVLDKQHPFVSKAQLALWRWISSYYMCFAGDVLRAALPSGLRWSDPQPFAPLTERFVRIAVPHYEGKLTAKQTQLLDTLKTLSLSGEGIPRRKLMEKACATESIFSALLKKGVLEAYDKTLPPQIKFSSTQHLQPLRTTLSEIQSSAYNILAGAVSTGAPALLKGITGSGKTEICTHLIYKTLQKGQQVIYLLPDAKSATFTEERLARHFGDRMTVYHSKTSQRDRLNLWAYLSQGNSDPLLVVGMRSALFLPFTGLGLIIVGDEHDDGYKQTEPAPRYHARNVALMLAQLHGAGIVLSSAAPSIESYHHAVNEKYVLAELSQRYGNIPLPVIHLENSSELRRKKIQKGIFSPLLLEKMGKTFASGGQVLLYQNRKHYARIAECAGCGWIPLCKHCQVTLSYSLQKASLLCSYCGQLSPLPKSCPQCGGPVELKGVGTERVEEELQQLFPSLRTARVDGDAVKNERQLLSVVKAFNAGEIDLLIGTQLLVGNFNFSRVQTVGVINGDLLLNAPDFRAHEKAFQIFVQLAGYAGCDGSESDMVVQTGQDQLPLMETLRNYDYHRMYLLQRKERELYGYPPYTRLIRIIITGNGSDPASICRHYSKLLISKLGNRVSGPITTEKPGRQLPAWLFLLKIESGVSYLAVRTALNEVQAEATRTITGFKKLHIAYDVDPVTTL